MFMLGDWGDSMHLHGQKELITAMFADKLSYQVKKILNEGHYAKCY
jgi:hypothetical protein